MAADRIDLADLSVVIPFRWDSPSRLENLAAIVAFFTTCAADAELIVIENGPGAHARDMTGPGVRHEFQRNDGVFFRTRMLNHAIEALCGRRFVAIHDADVLCYPDALRAAMAALRGGETAILPFDGNCYDIRGGARAALMRTLDFSALPPGDLIDAGDRYGRDVVRINRRSVGGAPLFDRRDLIACGGYNENFISWGAEDRELVERLSKLGRRLARTPGYPLLHLAHARGRNSSPRNPYFRRNQQAYRDIAALDRAGIERLIASGGLRHAGPPPADSPSAFRRLVASLTDRLGLR